ncbi:MAG: DmsE family decaheme c-type cytochrome [Elusimicrobia bacterium]|nr:DmsE family decaheme c-type cytochrome [Elusimicrobiota bacterium]
MTKAIMPLARAALVVAAAWIVTVAGEARAGEVDWTALNGAFKDAEFVKDPAVCFGCHGDYQKKYEATPHARLFKAGKALPSGECETCHGPRSKHVANPSRELALTPVQQNAACLQCHQGSGRLYWKSSKHGSGDLGCTSCHKVMERVSDKALLAKEREDQLCYTCHTEVRGQMNKLSRHPVNEGKVSCSGCHNPHGSVTKAMLKGASLNETCFKCHQEKRGPHVWIHPPVLEDCANCHQAHGSNHRKLLTGKDSFLCMSCHTYGGHVNLPRYNRVSSLAGEGCVNCHMAVHGSNSPSGAKLTR